MSSKFAHVALICAALLVLQVDGGARAQPTAPDGQVNANQHYTMVQLDTCGDTCTVGGINQSCEVVGSYHQPMQMGVPQQPQVAFIWRPTSAPQALDNARHGNPSPSDFVAVAINDAHVVVGRGTGPIQGAVRWTTSPTSSTWVPAPFHGENLHEAWAINSSGTAVGRVKTVASNDAWLWSGAATYNLGDLHHSAINHDATAFGINDNGAIVGTGEADIGASANITRAFYMSNQRMRMIDLGALGGGPGITHAAAINANGIIVGDSATGTGGTSTHAVLWSFPPGATTAQITDLGASWSVNTSANAINASGSIVGVAGTGATRRAIGWAPNGTQAIDLTQQVTNANGATVLEADGINANGVISGMAQSAGARAVVVVLIPTNRRLACAMIQRVPYPIQLPPLSPRH